jgi:hypothetical protein
MTDKWFDDRFDKSNWSRREIIYKDFDDDTEDWGDPITFVPLSRMWFINLKQKIINFFKKR